MTAEYPAWLVPFEPQVPLNPLVQEVNRLYHSFDASSYDREHPEIHTALPAIWEEMIAALPPGRLWRVLDFGCGTGFEAEQVARRLGAKIEALSCYDASVAMLERCRARLGHMGEALFTTRLADVVGGGQFNLLVTNSLLHHLPNIEETIAALLPSLTSDAIWLAGHEPSARFYRNPECVAFLDQYSRHYKWARFLKFSAYAQKLRFTLGPNPLRATAKLAFSRGLFKKRPSPWIIDRLVDFHVAHSAEEVANGRGLDFGRMRDQLSKDWNLTWIKTYSFLGSIKPTSVPRPWLERSEKLAERFPNDGANFCAVWIRKN